LHSNTALDTSPDFHFSYKMNCKFICTIMESNHSVVVCSWMSLQLIQWVIHLSSLSNNSIFSVQDITFLFIYPKGCFCYFLIISCLLSFWFKGSLFKCDLDQACQNHWCLAGCSEPRDLTLGHTIWKIHRNNCWVYDGCAWESPVSRVVLPSS